MLCTGLLKLIHAMMPTTPFATPRRYLFVIPPTTTLEEQHEVVRAAKALMPDDQVYVASAHESAVQDRENICYLPLHRNDIPSFGTVSGVMVARDTYLAQLAKRTYPGVPVMVFDPAETMPGQSSKTSRRGRQVTGHRLRRAA